MKHGILFSSLLVLVFVAAGGVFVLVSNGEQEEDVTNAFVASVSGGERAKELEINSSTDEKQAQKIEVNPQPAPRPIAKQPAPSPVPLAPQPEGDQPLAETPEAEPTPPPPPSAEESTPDPAPEPTPPPQPVGKININTANSSELQQLSGIGPVLASRIIDYRNNTSLFYKIEDIKSVKGIGDATFEKIKNNITVGNVSPAPQPSSPSPAPSPSPPPPSGKININTAGYEALQEITGVGPVIAQRIIDYRTQNGPFQRIEDIKNVSGIGEKTFEKMKDEITI